jgi:hypothetical protein
MYVSKAGVKDFGNRVRIDAYMYEEKGSRPDRFLAKKENSGKRTAPGEGGPAPE